MGKTIVCGQGHIKVTVCLPAFGIRETGSHRGFRITSAAWKWTKYELKMTASRSCHPKS